MPIETNLKMNESFFFQIQYIIYTFLCGDLQLSNTPSISCHIYMLIDHINNSLTSSFSFRYLVITTKTISTLFHRVVFAVTQVCVVLLCISAKQKTQDGQDLSRNTTYKWLILIGFRICFILWFVVLLVQFISHAKVKKVKNSPNKRSRFKDMI